MRAARHVASVASTMKVETASSPPPLVAGARRVESVRGAAAGSTVAG